MECFYIVPSVRIERASLRRDCLLPVLQIFVTVSLVGIEPAITP
jgi:hypothetical protein